MTFLRRLFVAPKYTTSTTRTKRFRSCGASLVRAACLIRVSSRTACQPSGWASLVVAALVLLLVPRLLHGWGPARERPKGQHKEMARLAYPPSTDWCRSRTPSKGGRTPRPSATTRWHPLARVCHRLPEQCRVSVLCTCAALKVPSPNGTRPSGSSCCCLPPLVTRSRRLSVGMSPYTVYPAPGSDEMEQHG